MNTKRDLLTAACLLVGVAFLSADGVTGLVGVGLTALAGLAAADSLHRRFGHAEADLHHVG